MIEFETTVRIGRTRGQVFSVLADFETYLARWAKGPDAAARTDGDGGVGELRHASCPRRIGGGDRPRAALQPGRVKQAVVAGAGWCRRP
jgi:hypothetical protein